VREKVRDHVTDVESRDGIFWVLRSGAPWRDLPNNYGPYTTCYNGFVRWRRAGVWVKIMNALANAHDAAVQMIDTSIVRVQHGACITRNQRVDAVLLGDTDLFLASDGSDPGFEWIDCADLHIQHFTGRRVDSQ
jgi:transposase